jgi:hypothetical protein
MSELEELEEIAEANAFGFHGLAPHGAPRHGGKEPTEACGAGHPWTQETTRRYFHRGRWRRVCRVCDKLRARSRAQAVLQAGGRHGDMATKAD